ncbi:MAG: methyltransferase domain-containing protein [Burkholderiaceae bacterium]
MSTTTSTAASAALAGQVGFDAADTYERFFVPALFRQWTGPMLDAARVGPDTPRVLDVACGTGVLARCAAQRVGTARDIVGVDPNEAMLAVARRVAPDIDWRAGRAEALPCEDASFDAVVCQFGLMFFEDRVAGLRQMLRVLRPGGRVAVWDALDRTPGFAELVRLLEQTCGSEAADALRAPFSLGNAAELASLARRAGLADPRIETRGGTARFASIDDWIRTNVRGWSFSALVDDDQLATLVAKAQRTMARFVAADASVAFDAPAHLLSARLP